MQNRVLCIKVGTDNFVPYCESKTARDMQTYLTRLAASRRKVLKYDRNINPTKSPSP